MTDDLLTTFRSEMPVPNEETTQRIYERATSGRRPLTTRRNLVALAAVLALAGIAAGLSLTLGGSAKETTGPPVVHPGGPGGPGGTALSPVTMDTNYANGELTSIDLTLRSTAAATTLDVKVVRNDSGDVVFDKQVSPTVLDTTMQDATHATWSGTLAPSDWNGGCQSGQYHIEYAFGPAGDSGATDPFGCAKP